MSNDRFFAFFGENRASLAMDIQNTDEQKNLTFALAFCNHRDDFNKKIARDILNGRLDAATDPERERRTRLTFRTTYKGEHPKRDIMNPLMTQLRQLPKTRGHDAIESTIRDMFLGFNGGREGCGLLSGSDSDSTVAPSQNELVTQ